MAATVDVKEINGAGGVETTVTAAKFCTDDDPAPGTDHPIPIVATLTKYSYWKSHELWLSATYTQISNIYIYTAGTPFGTGISTQIAKKAGAFGVPYASYDQADGTPNDTGLEVQANHAYGFDGKDDFFGKLVGSPALVDAGPYSTPPEHTKHVVLQMTVIDTASPGEKGPLTITWRYDEV